MSFPMRPLTKRQIPVETVAAIKESLYDDDSRKNWDALAIKYGVSMTFIRDLRLGHNHSTVSPILNTQK